MIMKKKHFSIFTFIALLALATTSVNAQSKQPISDVMIHRQSFYGFIVNGGYSQWNYGTLYTQSSMGSLSMIYALHPNINVYAGVGANSFVIEDPNVANSRLTQNLHLDYRAGVLLSLGFLYTDISWHYNPVKGELKRASGINTYLHKSTYQLHDFGAKLGAKFSTNAVVVAAGLYQEGVIGDQTRKIYRIQGDSNQLLATEKYDFSERAPLAVYGTLLYKVNLQYSLGFDVVFRDSDNFIIQFTYLKLAF